jgi:D-aspartate ligase
MTPTPPADLHRANAPLASAVDPSAIVLGGSFNAVSICRSLAPDRVQVIALGTGGVDFVRRSRHCARYVGFGGRTRLQVAWLEWLTENARDLRDSVLLPAEDDALELIATKRAELVELGYRPFEADDRALLAMLDKGQTAEIAREAGIALPRTHEVDDEASAEAAAADLGFPLALKPRHSHVMAKKALRLGKLVVVESRLELAERMAFLQANDVDVLAMEIVPGGDDQLVSYYTYIDEHGEPLLHFCKQQVRANPPSFGLSTYQRSCWDPELVETGLRFFRHAGVRGLVNVQFKRDPHDGTLKLIECNHRFTAANELVRRAGINLARVTYDRALGRPSAPIHTRVGETWMWDPISDTKAMLALRAEGALTLGEWLRTLFHRQHLPLLCLDDPLPAFVRVGAAVRAASRTRGRAA